MRKDRNNLEPIAHLGHLGHLANKRANSSGNSSDSHSVNRLAKRLHRDNSLNRLTPLNTSVLVGSLNNSLVPSISLRNLHRLDNSQPSIEISQGKIVLKKAEEMPFMTQQTSFLKKVGASKKF